MPVWATFMVFFTMASVGLPGLNGFISEFLCIFGTFQGGTFPAPNPGQTAGPLGPWYGFAAATGMIVAAMYLLYMLGRIVWGPLAEPHTDHAHAGHGHESEAPGHPSLPRDMSWREITAVLPLAVACLVLGVYPRPLLKALEAPTGFVGSMVRESHRNPGNGAPARNAAAPLSAPADAPAPALARTPHAEATP
jgi:NADH-quinone oxidoreductase subunit M